MKYLDFINEQIRSTIEKNDNFFKIMFSNNHQKSYWKRVS